MTAPVRVPEVAHSPLGGSSFYRWSECPGSIRLIRDLGSRARNAGQAAAEGSAAHFVAQQCLEADADAWTWVGREVSAPPYTFTVDDEMAEGVQTYLDYVNGRVESEVELYGEVWAKSERSLKSTVRDDLFGQGDFTLEVPASGLAEIVDLKYGMIRVDPSASQLRYYAALLLQTSEMAISRFRLTIAQPRLPGAAGSVRSVSASALEIEEWFRDVVIPAAEATEREDAVLKVGEWCRFCPARDHCPALKSEVVDFHMDVDPQFMTAEELAAIILKAPAIRRALDSYEREGFERQMAGDTLPGFKLVRKKTNRTFREGAEAALYAEYGDEIYSEPSLLSPAQLEKKKLVGGKEAVARWAFTPLGGLTMAPDTDNRPAVQVGGEAMFGAVEDDQADPS